MRISGILACAMLLAAAHPSHADDVADFYKGRQMQLLVGSAAGGAYDVSARILARHLVDHIPGHPTIVVQNVPGAGSLTLANQIYNISPRDGSVIALTNNGMPTAPYFTPDSARYDPRRFSWIGSSNRETEVVMLWHTAPANTIDDLFHRQIIVGGVAPGTATVDYPLVANAILGTKFKIVSGYETTGPINLAMERGEVQGDAGRGWTTAKTQDAELIKDKKVKIVAQYGFRKAVDLPDVPLFEMGKTDADRQALTMLYARQDYGRPFFAPPAIPPGRLAALRTAFEETLKDPGFLADAKTAGWDTEFVSGSELDDLTRRIASSPSEVAERLRAILNENAGH